MEQLQLLNMLEQLCHIDRKPSNQSISIPNLELLNLEQETTYQQGTWPRRSIPSQNEKLQVPHHKPVSRGNQDVGTITCSYCQPLPIC
jgi:hypothetical protein